MTFPEKECRVFDNSYFLRNGQMKKEDLPQKTCIVCERPFTWRKKWEKNWDAVKYCSQRCRKNK